jgi:hypothetical protein
VDAAKGGFRHKMKIVTMIDPGDWRCPLGQPEYLEPGHVAKVVRENVAKTGNSSDGRSAPLKAVGANMRSTKACYTATANMRVENLRQILSKVTSLFLREGCAVFINIVASIIYTATCRNLISAILIA